jgi:hypothetical protein
MPRGKLSQDLGRLDPAGPRYATDVVEHVLAQARAAEASDVLFTPVPMGWKSAGGSTACSSRSRSFPPDWRPMWWPGSRSWRSS